MPNDLPPDPALSGLRAPAHSVEAEQGVLGALLLDNEAFDRIADLVSSEDFYRHDHRIVYRAIARLIGQSKAADALTVYESLQATGDVAESGGLPYLNALAQNTPSAANVRRYAEIVRDHAMLRRLVATCDAIAADAFNRRGRSSRELLDEAEARILAIAEEGARGRATYAGAAALLPQVIERIQELYEKADGNGVTGVPTGYVDLDRMTSGLQPGDLIVIAGRPSMGKTALALNIAEHVAVRLVKPVFVFSMEMSQPQIMLRLMGSLGRIDQQRLRSGRLEFDDWTKLTDATAKLAEAPVFVDETPALNPMELRARSRRMRKAQGQPGLIVVDYLQLMVASRDGENRATEISEISRSLKALAKELGVPVIALSQLNRAVESRNDKRPLMADLRESGAIEQDADLILGIYRDEQYNKDTQDKGIAEIIVLKQRNGPLGTVRTVFRGEFTRFENLASAG